MNSPKAPERVEFANTLRGFACLAVIIAHYFGVFWCARPTVMGLINAPVESAKAIEAPRWIAAINQIPYFSWGAFGVGVFFLISGFVIPYSLEKATFAAFCIGRLFRILPTYFVGFTITLAAIGVSCWFFDTKWPYGFSEIIVHYVPGVRDLYGSRSIDGVVWTLEIEMKFYVLCAAMILLFRNHSPWVFVVPAGLSVISIALNGALGAIAQFGPSCHRLALAYLHAAPFLTFMFIGVAFNFTKKGKMSPDRAYLLMASLFTLFCIQWSSGPYKSSFAVAWSYGFALLIFGFAYCFDGIFKGNRVFDFIAGVSYPLYVAHGIAGYVALQILVASGIKPWLALAIVTLTAISVAWLIHLLVEKPSQAMGKAWARRIDDRLRATTGSHAAAEIPARAA